MFCGNKMFEPYLQRSGSTDVIHGRFSSSSNSDLRPSLKADILRSNYIHRTVIRGQNEDVGQKSLVFFIFALTIKMIWQHGNFQEKQYCYNPRPAGSLDFPPPDGESLMPPPPNSAPGPCSSTG